MDAFELVMDERHLDQRIGREQRVVVDEAFQVAHQGQNLVRVLRRGVDGASAIAFECRARQLAKAGTVALQFLLDLQDVVVGQQPGSTHGGKTNAQGLAVVSNFLGRCAAGGVGENGFAKQFVVSGDDVLDFGTVFGLL